MKPHIHFLMAACIACSTGAVAARESQAPAPAAAAPAVQAPTPAPDYAYDASERRDPFVSLVHSGTEAKATSSMPLQRPAGVAGIMVDEVAVRGIVQTRGNFVAMIAAANGRNYTIRPGDRLMDGSVRAINAQAVMLMQEVKNPLSLEKQREVRKQLRGEVK